MAQKQIKVKLICESCKEEFEVLPIYANQGRKYCNKECMENGRHYHEKDLLIANKK